MNGYFGSLLYQSGVRIGAERSPAPAARQALGQAGIEANLETTRDAVVEPVSPAETGKHTVRNNTEKENHIDSKDDQLNEAHRQDADTISTDKAAVDRQIPGQKTDIASVIDLRRSAEALVRKCASLDHGAP